MNRRRTIAALAAVALAATSAGAVAASQHDRRADAEQAVLNDAAKRLDVSPRELRDALAAAQDAHLDAAVKNGKLTEQQASKLKQRRERSGLVLRMGGHGHRGGTPDPKFAHRDGGLAEALGITGQQLRSELRAGKSLPAIAKAHGKKFDDVKATLKAAARSRLDAAVKAGKLTEQQAEKFSAGLDTRFERLGERPFGRGRFEHPHLRPGGERPRDQGSAGEPATPNPDAAPPAAR